MNDGLPPGLVSGALIGLVLTGAVAAFGIAIPGHFEAIGSLICSGDSTPRRNAEASTYEGSHRVGGSAGGGGIVVRHSYACVHPDGRAESIGAEARVAAFFVWVIPIAGLFSYAMVRDEKRRAKQSQPPV